jgi:hypothetical protein
MKKCGREEMCCGMSMTLNGDLGLKRFMFKNMEISNARFGFLLSVIFLCSAFNEVFKEQAGKAESRIKKLHEPFPFLKCLSIGLFYHFFVFLAGWSLMMLSMTSNLYILGFMLGGKIAGRGVSCWRDKGPERCRKSMNGLCCM